MIELNSRKLFKNLIDIISKNIYFYKRNRIELDKIFERDIFSANYNIEFLKIELFRL